jgi:putative ABC transport system substrate-binding protein
VKRRTFIAGLGSAVVWPVVARAQQPAMPVIGYLGARSSETDVAMLAAVRRGLAEIGYAEGRNVAIEYRFADGQYDRLPALAMDLTSRHVAVIIYTGANDSPENAVYQTLRASNIPIVFNVGTDPVLSGFVASFNHPGSNMTGVHSLVSALTAKHLGLLHDLVPNAKTIAVLADASSVVPVKDAREAATPLGLQLIILIANTEGEIEAAFASLNQQRADAMVVPANPFFFTRAKLIATLATRHGLPAIYARREFAEAGGLMSYGYDVADGYRQVGNYAGRILKGDKPGDLPVVQPTKFELVINLKTAKALGLTIPETLLATADEVIQ